MPQPIAFTRPDQRVMQYQPWTDDDLHSMSQVSEQDIADATLYWTKALPARFKRLLDAL